MGPRIALSARLSRRLLRSSALRRSSAALGVIVAGLVTLFLVQGALTLSASQVAARDLGRSNGRIVLPAASPVADTAGLLSRAAVAATAAGATDIQTEMSSIDIQPATPNPPFTIYLEADWQHSPYPERFLLTQGRWPVAPGEVVVTSSLRPRIDRGDQTIAVLSGLVRLKAVGLVQDRYAESGTRILAAPGTLAAVDLAKITERFSALDIQAALGWRSGDDRRIRRSVAAAVPGSDPLRVINRRGIIANPPRTFAEKYPLGYRIPALALPCLGVLIVFAVGMHSLRRTTNTMRASGVGRWVITAAVTGAAGGLAVASAGAGVVVGAGVGLAARPLLKHIAQAPLSPIANVESSIVHLLVVVVAACAVGAIWATRAYRPPRPTLPGAGLGRATSSWRGIRVTFVSAAAIATVGASLLPLDGVAAAMTTIAGLGGVLLLLTPEIIGACLRFVPDVHPRGRLARRQLEGARSRTVVAILLLAIALGGPLAFATMLATMIETDQADQVPATAPGQLKVLSDGGTRPAPAEIVRVVGRALRGTTGEPVVVSRLYSDERRVELPGHDGGIVMAVQRPVDLARLSSHPLSVRQRQTLLRGGILQWNPSGGDVATMLVETAEGKSTIGPIPTAPIELDRAWEGAYGGVLLASTATRLHLPVVPGEEVFTNVPDSAAEQAKSAAIAAGLDPYYVKIYQAPADSRAPPVFYIALVALSTIVVLTVMFVVRAQASALRRLLGSLTAIGVPPSWARGVLLIQVGFAATISEVLALVIAGPIVALAVARLPGFDLLIPWGWLAEISAACFLAIAISALISTRRLRAVDRMQV